MQLSEVTKFANLLSWKLGQMKRMTPSVLKEMVQSLLVPVDDSDALTELLYHIIGDETLNPNGLMSHEALETRAQNIVTSTKKEIEPWTPGLMTEKEKNLFENPPNEASRFWNPNWKLGKFDGSLFVRVNVRLCCSLTLTMCVLQERADLGCLE